MRSDRIWSGHECAVGKYAVAGFSPRSFMDAIDWISSDLQLAGAVAKLILLNPELVQDAQRQFRHWRVCRVLQVPAAFHLAGGASHQDDGKRIMVMLVSVAEGAAVKHQRMVQKVAIAIGRLL